MSIAIVKNQLAEMKLFGMLDVLEESLAEATRDQLTGSELMNRLIQAEADYRKRRKTANRIKTAKFRDRPSFEDFDFTAKRSITRAQIKDIYSLEWLEEARPLMLIGPTGLHACANGKSVWFTSITKWLEHLNLARSSGSYLRYRDKLAKFDLIIFDEMGSRKLTATEAQDLCEILEERSVQKSVVFTSQLPLDHWSEVIADTVIADAIFDRLKHSALTIEVTGESYRGVKARKLAGRKKVA
jgi:DNA replication protein DnaC